MTDTQEQAAIEAEDYGAHRHHVSYTGCSICSAHAKAAAELDELSSALIDSRAALLDAQLTAGQWKAQARTWEDNAGQAVHLANREQRKRQEAYTKLDILTAEYRRLALTLADAMRWITGTNDSGDQIETVTERLLASLQRQTDKLEAGDSRDGDAGKTAAEAAVEPGLAGRGANSPH